MEFKVIKSANEIEDICIAYGICKILDDNEIEYNLKDNKSMYSIYTEEFNIDDIIYYDLDNENKSWNISSHLTYSEYKKKIGTINKCMQIHCKDVLKSILDGYGLSSLKFGSKSENTKFMHIGSCYYSKDKANKDWRESIYKQYLAVIGWIYGASYIHNDNIEITLLLKPVETNDIKKPYNLVYTDKETGEMKILTRVRSSSEINMIARLYCETIKNKKLVSDEYCEIIFIKSIISGNKPLPNKCSYIKIYDNFSFKFYDDMLKFLTYSNIPIDVENATSNYICNIERYNSFSNLIKMCSKNDKYINYELKGEMLSMYSETVQEIYNNENIKNLGRRLNRLLRDNKGYNSQVKLYNVANAKHLQSAIRSIVDEYRRSYNQYPMNDVELLEIINLIDSKDKARICADAIIAYSKVFIEFKKDKEEVVEGDVE